MNQNQKIFDGEHVSIWKDDEGQKLVVCVGSCHLFLDPTEFDELIHGVSQILHQTSKPIGDMYK